MGNENTIVVVEDDHVYRNRLVQAFEDRGLQAYGAADINDLKTQLAEKDFNFAVVDLMLGHESGLDALKEINGKNSNCRAVILTGYGTISTTVQAMKDGAINYLTKPTDPDAILQVLRGEISEQQPNTNNRPTLAQLEWEHIQGVLQEHEGNVTQAAKALGMHRRTLQRKLLKDPGKLQ